MEGSEKLVRSFRRSPK